MTQQSDSRSKSMGPAKGHDRLLTTVIALSLTGLVVSGCSDFRKAIGEEKSSPDEFEVVVRPPLTLPPSFAATSEQLTTNTNKSGALSASSAAAKAFGSAETEVREGYGQVFNFAAVPDGIRELVDEETYGIRFERRLPLQVLFGSLPDIGPVLDKMAEDQRLRRNLREGLLPNEGATPAVDSQTNESLTVGD